MIRSCQKELVLARCDGDLPEGRLGPITKSTGRRDRSELCTSSRQSARSTSMDSAFCVNLTLAAIRTDDRKPVNARRRHRTHFYCNRAVWKQGCLVGKW